jgi:hypothetical protein
MEESLEFTFKKFLTLLEDSNREAKFEFFLVYLELINQSECIIKILMIEIREFVAGGVTMISFGGKE